MQLFFAGKTAYGILKIIPLGGGLGGLASAWWLNPASSWVAFIIWGVSLVLVTSYTVSVCAIAWYRSAGAVVKLEDVRINQTDGLWFYARVTSCAPKSVFPRLFLESVAEQDGSDEGRWPSVQLPFNGYSRDSSPILRKGGHSILANLFRYSSEQINGNRFLFVNINGDTIVPLLEPGSPRRPIIVTLSADCGGEEKGNTDRRKFLVTPRADADEYEVTPI
jgi:hypothetical protein